MTSQIVGSKRPALWEVLHRDQKAARKDLFQEASQLLALREKSKNQARKLHEGIYTTSARLSQKNWMRIYKSNVCIKKYYLNFDKLRNKSTYFEEQLAKDSTSIKIDLDCLGHKSVAFDESILPILEMLILLCHDPKLTIDITDEELEKTLSVAISLGIQEAVERIELYLCDKIPEKKAWVQELAVKFKSDLVREALVNDDIQAIVALLQQFHLTGDSEILVQVNSRMQLVRYHAHYLKSLKLVIEFPITTPHLSTLLKELPNLNYLSIEAESMEIVNKIVPWQQLDRLPNTCLFHVQDKTQLLFPEHYASFVFAISEDGKPHYAIAFLKDPQAYFSAFPHPKCFDTNLLEDIYVSSLPKSDFQAFMKLRKGCKSLTAWWNSDLSPDLLAFPTPCFKQLHLNVEVTQIDSSFETFIKSFKQKWPEVTLTLHYHRYGVRWNAGMEEEILQLPERYPELEGVKILFQMNNPDTYDHSEDARVHQKLVKAFRKKWPNVKIAFSVRPQILPKFYFPPIIGYSLKKEVNPSSAAASSAIPKKGPVSPPLQARPEHGADGFSAEEIQARQEKYRQLSDQERQQLEDLTRQFQGFEHSEALKVAKTMFVKQPLKEHIQSLISLRDFSEAVLSHSFWRLLHEIRRIGTIAMVARFVSLPPDEKTPYITQIKEFFAARTLCEELQKPQQLHSSKLTKGLEEVLQAMDPERTEPQVTQESDNKIHQLPKTQVMPNQDLFVKTQDVLAVMTPEQFQYTLNTLGITVVGSYLRPPASVQLRRRKYRVIPR